MKINFAYTALQVRDLDESVKFYTTILGMKLRVRKFVKQTNGEMCVLEIGTNTLELNHYRGQGVKKGTNLDHLAFETNQFDSLLETLRRKHVRIHEYLETKKWDRFFIADPDGNWIEVYHRK